jgi:hypothetical protein
MITWDIFWSAFGGTTTALAVLGASFTYLIQHRLNLQLASFNSGLQQDLAKASAELSIIGKRQEITFSRLHEKRADATAELFRLVTLVTDSLSSLLVSMKIEDRLGNANESLELKRRTEYEEAFTQALELSKNMKRNRIYFTRGTYRKLEILELALYENVMLYRDALYASVRKLPTITQIESLLSEVNKATLVLEEEFRKLIGVSE